MPAIDRFVYLMAIKTVVVDLMMGIAVIYLAFAVRSLQRQISQLRGDDDESLQQAQ